MASVNLLTRGNTKLGEAVYSFSIPAGPTCPGSTPSCTGACYAQKGRFLTDTMHSRLSDNLDATVRRDFAPRVVKEINRRGVHLLRWHVAGDIYDHEYAAKLIAVMERTPRTTHYLYTRSWRVPEIRHRLGVMAELDNAYVWFSLDRDTGTPEDVPPRVRLAYMQTEPDEDPGDVQLVFKVPAIRHTRSTRYPLGLVCSTEVPRPGEDRSCTNCRRCFSE